MGLVPKPPISPVPTAPPPTLLRNAKTLSPDAGKNLEALYMTYPILRPFIDAEIDNCDSYSDVEELYRETLRHHDELIRPLASAFKTSGTGEIASEKFWDVTEQNCDETVPAVDSRALDLDAIRAKFILTTNLSIFVCLGLCLGLMIVTDGWSPMSDVRQFLLLAIAGFALGAVPPAEYRNRFRHAFRIQLPQVVKAIKTPRLKLQAPDSYDECPNCQFEGQYLWVPGEQSLTCIRCGHSLEFKRLKGDEHETH